MNKENGDIILENIMSCIRDSLDEIWIPHDLLTNYAVFDEFTWREDENKSKLGSISGFIKDTFSNENSSISCDCTQDELNTLVNQYSAPHARSILDSYSWIRISFSTIIGRSFQEYDDFDMELLLVRIKKEQENLVKKIEMNDSEKEGFIYLRKSHTLEVVIRMILNDRIISKLSDEDKERIMNFPISNREFLDSNWDWLMEEFSNQFREVLDMNNFQKNSDILQFRGQVNIRKPLP